jgi:hypothetical protein
MYVIKSERFQKILIIGSPNIHFEDFMKYITWLYFYWSTLINVKTLFWFEKKKNHLIDNIHVRMKKNSMIKVARLLSMR